MCGEARSDIRKTLSFGVLFLLTTGLLPAGPVTEGVPELQSLSVAPRKENILCSTRQLRQ